jgi:predicted GTPase
MHNRLENDSALLKELHNKHLVLIMGRTGSGKSTLANAMISGSGSISYNPSYSGLTTSKPLTYNDRAVFLIGTDIVGCT